MVASFEKGVSNCRFNGCFFPQCMVNLVSLGGSFAFTIRFERNDDFAFQKQISTLS